MTNTQKRRVVKKVKIVSKKEAKAQIEVAVKRILEPTKQVLAYTKDYSRFKHLYYNRKIEQSNVIKLATIIKKVGFRGVILVSSDMFVVDGQHRLDAARLLGIEVPYVIIPIKSTHEYLPFLVAEFNSSQKGWKNPEYFNMWCEIGLPAYIYMGEIMNKYNIDITSFLLISNAYSKGWGKGANPFKLGELNFTTETKRLIQLRANQLKEIRLLNLYWKSYRSSSSFLRAITNVVRTTDYDHGRMIEQLNKFPSLIPRCTSINDYIDCFEDAYNRGKTQKNRIKFNRR